MDYGNHQEQKVIFIEFILIINSEFQQWVLPILAKHALQIGVEFEQRNQSRFAIGDRAMEEDQLIYGY